MLNIGVMGGPEFNLGFQLSGIKKTFEITEEADKVVEEALNDSEIGILIVDNTIMDRLDERIREQMTASVQPVCIQIGTEEGGQDELRKMIKKSIGIDLWSE